MRARAPAVSLHCQGGPVWRALQWLLPGLAAAVFSAWVCGHWGDWGHWGHWRPGSERSAPVLAAVMLLSGLATAWVAHRATPRQHVALVWDGQRWLVGDTPGTPGTPHVMVDLGAWLLLRFCPTPAAGSTRVAGRRRAAWVAVARADAGNPATWHALRVALYARAPSPPADQPSAR
jgi:hypothetical protein